MLIKLAVCLCSVIGMLLLYMVDKMAVVTSAKKEKNSSLSVLAVSFFKKYATREIMWRVPVEELKLHSLPESLCFRLHKKIKKINSISRTTWVVVIFFYHCPLAYCAHI